MMTEAPNTSLMLMLHSRRYMGWWRPLFLKISTTRPMLDTMMKMYTIRRRMKEGIKDWEGILNPSRIRISLPKLREAVQNDDDEAGHQQDCVDGQVCGAGLQCFSVQSLVLTAQTHHGDPQVGERDAADGRTQQDHGVSEAVDVVDEHALTGQLEQGGIIAGEVDNNPPAARQTHTEADEDPHHGEGDHPRPHGQTQHHPVGHDGGVAQRVADGHVAIERHDHEHGVRGAGVEVDAEGLDNAVHVPDDPLRVRRQEVPENMRDDDGGPEHIVDAHVAQQEVHGLVEAAVPEDQHHQAHVGHHDEDITALKAGKVASHKTDTTFLDAVQGDDDEGGRQHEDVHGQMSGAGLQRFAVQSLVLTAQTHHGDPQVGERDATHGGSQDDHGVSEGVDVVDEHALAGEVEQGGVVAERVGYHPPATRQTHAEADEDRDANECGRPRPHRQTQHHPVGHDGGVAQRVADGHVAVKRHDHEHGVRGARIEVNTEGLEGAVDVMDVALWLRNENVTENMRCDNRSPKNVINTHVAEQQVHGLVQAAARTDQHHQRDVRHQSKDVDEEEEDEGGDGGLGGDLQPLQEENWMENYTFNSFTLLLEGLKVTETSMYPVFFFFFFSYLIIILVNVGIVILIFIDKNLQQPMYLLFCNLPFNDILGNSIMVPRLLIDILRPPSVRLISYPECVVQAFSHICMICGYLLSSALFCYNDKQDGDQADSFCLGMAFVTVGILLGLTIRLNRCGTLITNPFCDNASLFKLSCESVFINNVYGLTFTVVLLTSSIGCIVITYSKITVVCLMNKNKSLNSKALKTCSTHLSVYLIMLLSGMFVILLHRFPQYSDYRKLAAILFHIIPGSLNPIIYGVQSKEIRKFLSQLFQHKKVLPSF
ncbi:hypothetical protein F7725_006409 [Dissostichus mawsoni]|uniref:G-protein coupled receptors family 1 profile domain-containing protein n=1 Tax=Dissostichus mawsoni TaxID=36200 RepID=A0A7J5XVH5_DISMA|nr:hypothetical protein F7725_006409 [Dissostichus mawsoni]